MLADLAVIGGGVIGTSIARAAAVRGMSVLLLDAESENSQATRAAAGILSPTDPNEWHGELGEFNIRAIERWPAWAAELEQETGFPSGLEVRGEIRLGGPAKDDEAFLSATVEGARHAGLACHELAASELRELEPSIADETRPAVYLPEAAAVETDALMRAMTESCRVRGVGLMANSEVSSVDLGASHGVDLLLADGPKASAERVVLAAGAWLGGPWLPTNLRSTLRPVLGESLIVRSAGPALCARTLRTRDGSIVPRADGTYWVGTTVLERGFQSGPSVASLRRIAANAVSVIKELDAAIFVEARSGLRPVSTDGHPLVGPLHERVFLAGGHGREGIIHAPLCAEIVVEGLVRGDWSAVPSSFRPMREL